jgi:hypothetical protein
MAPQCLPADPESVRLASRRGDVAFQHLVFMVDVRQRYFIWPLIFTYTSLRCNANDEAPHAADRLAADVRRKERTRPVPPRAHRLMANVDATLGQQVLRIA